ncbi:MAG: hypothetical protein Fur003_3090 [Candidatus Dojkabacteria bacterium]
MKQHPIPHNILDIEFKLFGKFTAKEFVYIAIGVGIGWIFLMLRSNGQMPGFIAWPVFFISSGIGLFLGLVPLNDQKADVFMGNYINAITRPTRRVWKNSQFDEQLETIAQERGVVLTKGTMARDLPQENNGNKNIVGGAPQLSNNQFIPQQNLDLLEQEEKQKLERLTALAQQEGAVASGRPTTTKPLVAEPVAAPISADPLRPYAQPTAQTLSTEAQISSAPVSNTPVSSSAPLPSPSMSVSPAATAPKTVSEIAIKQTGVNLPKAPQVFAVKGGVTEQLSRPIVISSETAKNYSSGASIDAQPNTPYIQATNVIGEPLPGTIIMIKDQKGVVVQAHRSNEKGYIIPQRALPSGEYIVELQNDKYNFPQVKYVADNNSIQPISIKALN